MIKLGVKAGEYLEKLTDEAPNEEAFLAKYYPGRKKLPLGFVDLMRFAQRGEGSGRAL